MLKWRSSVCMPFVGLALLGVSACSGDRSTPMTVADLTTTTQITDEDFATSVEQYDLALVDAGTDLCAVIDVPNEKSPPAATNPRQMRQAVDAYTATLRAYGVASGDTAMAEALAAAADQVDAHAQEAGYPKGYLDSPPAPLAESQSVLDEFTQLADSRCGEDG